MYDIENALEDVKKIFTTKFNERVTAISNEKAAAGVPIELPLVDMTNGVYEQTWNDGILNHKVAIFYGIESSTANSVGPATALTYKVFVDVVTTDSGQDKFGIKRVHRYTRAMREIFEENRHRFKVQSNLKIDAVNPFSFRREEDSSDEIRVGGVLLTLDLAY